MKKCSTLSFSLKLVALFVALCAVNAQAQKPGLITSEITCLAADSLTMHGWITHTPDRPKAPLIVCLPMMGQDHGSYDNLVQAVVEKALLTKEPVPYILTVDLRGHGKSVQRGKATLSAPGMPPEEFANYPSDVASIIRAAIRDSAYHVDSTDIRIIGASIGANTAPGVAQVINGVSRIVLLSPGMDYRGLKPADPLVSYAGKTLLVVAEKDEYAYDSVQRLAAKAPEAKVLTYPGHPHGTDIINSIPEALSTVVDWIVGKQ